MSFQKRMVHIWKSDLFTGAFIMSFALILLNKLFLESYCLSSPPSCCCRHYSNLSSLCLRHSTCLLKSIYPHNPYITAFSVKGHIKFLSSTKDDFLRNEVLTEFSLNMSCRWQMKMYYVSLLVGFSLNLTTNILLMIMNAFYMKWNVPASLSLHQEDMEWKQKYYTHIILEFIFSLELKTWYILWPSEYFRAEGLTLVYESGSVITRTLFHFVLLLNRILFQ